MGGKLILTLQLVIGLNLDWTTLVFLNVSQTCTLTICVIGGLSFYPPQTFLVQSPCVHISQADDRARLKMGTVQCLSFWPWVSKYHVWRVNMFGCQNTTRNVKLTYLSGCRGREEPCCVMWFVTNTGPQLSWYTTIGLGGCKKVSHFAVLYFLVMSFILISKQKCLIPTSYTDSLSLGLMSSIESNLLQSGKLSFLLRDGLQRSHKPAH